MPTRKGLVGVDTAVIFRVREARACCVLIKVWSIRKADGAKRAHESNYSEL